jgi:hypothetical protein
MPVKMENVGLGHNPFKRQGRSKLSTLNFTMDTSTRTAPPIDDDLKFEKGDVEYIEEASHLDANLDVQDTIKGTVGLTGEGGEVVLIPTPSADPSGMCRDRMPERVVYSSWVNGRSCSSDPLNMVWWRKWALVVILSTCKRAFV